MDDLFRLTAREVYIKGLNEWGVRDDDAGEDFDRWLAAHDAVLEAELQTTKQALAEAEDLADDRPNLLRRIDQLALRSGVTPDKEGNTK